MGCPVEAELAKELIGAEATHHYVVARFGVMINVATGVIGHVVTNDRAINTALGGNALNEVAVVAQQQTIFQTGLEPVVTLSTENRFNTGTTISEVVALAEQELLIIWTTNHHIAAGVGDDQVEAGATVNNVVTSAGANLVVTEGIGDHIGAFSTEDEVVADTTFEVVVAAITPEGVVAVAADQGVGFIRATKHHMLAANKLEQIIVEISIQVSAQHLLVAVHRSQEGIEAVDCTLRISRA